MYFFLFLIDISLHLELAMVNEFEGMKGELDEIEWSDNISLLTSYMKKWRIIFWTKAF